MNNFETQIEKLEKLQIDIYEYATYLRDYTYQPYNKVAKFGDELGKIISEMR